ncbi:MAG: glutathione S-transferase family protein [Woeseiaceae bacterium]|nr:glutathione S-transferase family protein [Woeseiaceae bacterium]
MLELYHWEPVSHSARVLICLHEIGLEFKSHYVDLVELQQFSSDFLAINPMGQVPVLRVGDTAISKSCLINEYLAESHPDAGVAPLDPLGWYTTQTWSKYIDYNLSNSLATLGCKKHLVPMLEELDKKLLDEKIAAIPVAERQPGWNLAANDAFTDEMIENSYRKIGLVVERMEKALAQTDWLVGDRFSIADIDAFALMYPLTELAADIVNSDDAPGTCEWLARIAERTAVKEALTNYGRHKAGTAFAPGPEHSRWG